MDMKHFSVLRPISEDPNPKTSSLTSGMVTQKSEQPYYATVTQASSRSSCGVQSTLDSETTFYLENSARLEPEQLSLNTVANSAFHPTSGESVYNNLKSTQSRGDRAAALLKSCRQAVERAEGKRPLVPQRSTSMTRPAKRKRHEDFVAFHRNSCQLFSSIDGTLAQIRKSTVSTSSSSSSVSSLAASSSPPPSAPVSGSSTRDTSLDYSFTDAVSKLTVVDESNDQTSSVKTKAKRPSLQRMNCTVPATAVQTNQNCAVILTKFNDSTPTTPTLVASPTSISAPSTEQLTPKSRPSITTTSSFYSSSQTNLPSHHSASLIPPTKPTTIHWTSPETRRREYAKIDAANSGFRFFLRRIIPCGLATRVGGGRAAFWDEKPDDEEDDGDARSVRRFRVSVDDKSDASAGVRDSETKDNCLGISSCEDGWDEKAVRLGTKSKSSPTSSIVISTIPSLSRARSGTLVIREMERCTKADDAERSVFTRLFSRNL